MNNVIVIGSHFDDIELSAGGTIALLSKKYNIIAIVTSLSDYADYEGNIIRTETQARIEGEKGLLTLGVKEIYRLNYQTKKIPYNSTIIEDLNKIIDLYAPELIIIPWINDTHPDHSNTAKSAISASRYYNTIWMY